MQRRKCDSGADLEAPPCPAKRSKLSPPTLSRTAIAERLRDLEIQITPAVDGISELPEELRLDRFLASYPHRAWRQADRSHRPQSVAVQSGRLPARPQSTSPSM